MEELKNSLTFIEPVDRLWESTLVKYKSIKEAIMPKMKTKSSVSKRMKRTKSGKIKRNSAKTSHLFANKSTKNKRQARKASYLSKGDANRYKDIV